MWAQIKPQRLYAVHLRANAVLHFIFVKKEVHSFWGNWVKIILGLEGTFAKKSNYIFFICDNTILNSFVSPRLNKDVHFILNCYIPEFFECSPNPIQYKVPEGLNNQKGITQKWQTFFRV